MEAELKKVETAIGRLIADVEAGAGASVRDRLRQREREKSDLLARPKHLDGLARSPWLDTLTLRARLQAEVAEWRTALTEESVKARQIVRKLLKGRLLFAPDPEHAIYTITGQPSYGRLLAGVVQNRECPRGDSNTRHAV